MVSNLPSTDVVRVEQKGRIAHPSDARCALARKVTVFVVKESEVFGPTDHTKTPPEYLFVGQCRSIEEEPNFRVLPYQFPVSNERLPVTIVITFRETPFNDATLICTLLYADEGLQFRRLEVEKVGGERGFDVNAYSGVPVVGAWRVRFEEKNVVGVLLAHDGASVDSSAFGISFVRVEQDLVTSEAVFIYGTTPLSGDIKTTLDAPMVVVPTRLRA